MSWRLEMAVRWARQWVARNFINYISRIHEHPTNILNSTQSDLDPTNLQLGACSWRHFLGLNRYFSLVKKINILNINTPTYSIGPSLTRSLLWSFLAPTCASVLGPHQWKVMNLNSVMKNIYQRDAHSEQIDLSKCEYREIQSLHVRIANMLRQDKGKVPRQIWTIWDLDEGSEGSEGGRRRSKYLVSKGTTSRWSSCQQV